MKKGTGRQNIKVIAIYQAVITLIERGEDIGELKVSDITGEAGIGKGTAYEYFSSKDDIITSALKWDLMMQIAEVKKKLVQAKSMKEQILMGLDWVEQHVHRRSAGIQFLRLSAESRDLEKCMQDGCASVHANGELSELREIIELILKKGEEEGKINHDLPRTFQRFILISNYLGFFILMNRKKEGIYMKGEDVKEFIYQTICKSLY